MKNYLSIRRLIKRIIVFACFVASLSYCFAAGEFKEGTSVDTDFGPVTSLGQYVGRVFTWASSIIVSVVIVVIIYAGYLYITSAGNPDQATRAKNFIITAITSLALVILAIFIIKAINPNIQLGF